MEATRTAAAVMVAAIRTVTRWAWGYWRGGSFYGTGSAGSATRRHNRGYNRGYASGSYASGGYASGGYGGGSWMGQRNSGARGSSWSSPADAAGAGAASQSMLEKVEILRRSEHH